MTDAQMAIQTDHSALVNQIIRDAEENSVDAYLDGLEGPSVEDLKDMTAKNDLEDEEME